MTKARKTAHPVEEPIFTKAPAAVESRVESESAFFDRVKKQIDERRHGRRQQAIATVSFESVEVLLSVLTPKRYALFLEIKRHGHFASIEALATQVKRNRASVSRDLKAMAQAGLLRMQEATLPGHGKRMEVVPVAETLKLELTL